MPIASGPSLVAMQSRKVQERNVDRARPSRWAPPIAWCAAAGRCAGTERSAGKRHGIAAAFEQAEVAAEVAEVHLIRADGSANATEPPRYGVNGPCHPSGTLVFSAAMLLAI